MNSKLNVLNKTVSRRQLLQGLAVVSAALLPVKLLAQVAAPIAEPVKVKVVVSEIGRNHGHEFTIVLADLVNGGKKVYSIQGTSRHPHGIEITEEMITALNQGKKFVTTSTVDAGHDHEITLSIVEK